MRIAGDAPPASPAGAAVLAAAGSAERPGRRLTITVTLKRTRKAAFERYLAAVYDPHSPLYRRYLSQAQLADRFGPSRSAYTRVKSWLVSQGFTIAQTSANRLSLSVHGTEAQAVRAFHTSIVRSHSGTRVVYENVEAPAMPATLAAHVKSVMGLSNRAAPAVAPSNTDTPTTFSACVATGLGVGAGVFTSLGTGFFSAVWLELVFAGLSAFWVIAGVTALGLAGLVAACAVVAAGGSSPGPAPGVSSPGLASGASATGLTSATADAVPLVDPQKIGLLEFDTYRPSDVADWLSLLDIDAGSSPASRLQEIAVNGGVASPGPGESEVLLDIDTVLGIAPAAPTSYVVYDAPPSTSFVQMFQAMVADGDTVISNSWSQCEDQTPAADAQAIDSVLASAAASGISVLNGSGDHGGTCLDGSPDTVGVPADSPHATAVGGTSITFGPGLTYGSESYWDGSAATPATGAGGFGTSRYFTRPSYQDGHTSSSMRSVPDLSFNADPNAGISICEADAGGCPDGLLWGGTSMAAPEVAAEVANLNTALGYDVGDLNTALYPLGGTAAFHTPASMGSDFAHVGLGSPVMSSVLQQLAGTPTGPVSASTSTAGTVGVPQADGSQQGLVRVDLRDANGFPVPGQTVTVTPNGGSAVVSPASATTDATDGAAVFTVTDTSAETVTFTVVGGGVTLPSQPTLSFTPPSATGGEISAGPRSVPADGSSQATIEVYLQNGLGRPAAGKTVTLSQTGSAVITPAGSNTPGNTAVTDASGYATFTATDTTQQNPNFTAVDTTDGLPVPGSASVTYYSGGAPPSCGNSPVPASPYGIVNFASPFDADPLGQLLPGNFFIGACTGVDPPAFDASGNAYVANDYTGTISVFTLAGGTAGPSNQLPDANLGRDDISGLAFGQDGELYASLTLPPPAGVNNNEDPEIAQLDPATGAIVRVVATHADGVPYCPNQIAVDPLTGDLFVAGGCSGYLYSGKVVRIADPASAGPTVSNYASVSGIGNGIAYGLAFAPDGTLYAAVGGTELVEISGTDQSQPASVTTLGKYITSSNYSLGLAVTAVDGNGAATQLVASDLEGYAYAIDPGTNPLGVTTVVTPGVGNSVFGYEQVGPDGCVYLAAVTAIDRFGPGSCGSPGNVSSTPSISLTESSGSGTPAVGSAIGFTATLANVPSPSGTPIHFTISGPNSQASLADADGSGQATAGYSGVFQGVDTVTAWTVVNGSVITSAPVKVHWQTGKATTFLDLNISQPGGPEGVAATVRASLWDVTQSPFAPVAGKTVTLDLGGQSCQAQTDGNGIASCQLTPQSMGLLPVIATFGGDGSYTPASSSDVFVSGGPLLTSAPVNVDPPVISGTPAVGEKLTCSKGTWRGTTTSFAYEWNREGSPIGGADGKTYQVQAADAGHSLTCTVTAYDDTVASQPATSAPVYVSNGPACTRTVSGHVTGDLTVPDGEVYCLESTASITHDVIVDAGGTLIDLGAAVGHDLASSGEVTVAGGTVGHDLEVIDDHAGATIQRAGVGHDIVVRGSRGGLTVGHDTSQDIQAEHNHGPLTIAHDSTGELRVLDNEGKVVVNHDTVGGNLDIENNGPPTKISHNHAGGDATCLHNEKQTGKGNTGGHNTCPR